MQSTIDAGLIPPHRDPLIPPHRGGGPCCSEAKAGGGGIRNPPHHFVVLPSAGGESLTPFAIGAVLHKKTPRKFWVSFIWNQAFLSLMGVEFGANSK